MRAGHALHLGQDEMRTLEADIDGAQFIEKILRIRALKKGVSSPSRDCVASNRDRHSGVNSVSKSWYDRRYEAR